MAENERQFEENIEKYLISPAGGYEKADDSGYRASVDMALDIETLVQFVKKTQPLVWQWRVRRLIPACSRTQRSIEPS